MSNYYATLDPSDQNRIRSVILYQDAPDHVDLPIGVVTLTQAQHDAAIELMPNAGWDPATGVVALPSVARAYPVPKLDVVRRLNAAGALVGAYRAMKMGADPVELSAEELFEREQWSASTYVMSDDAFARGLLAAVAPADYPNGATAFVNAILAPPT